MDSSRLIRQALDSGFGPRSIRKKGRLCDAAGLRRIGVLWIFIVFSLCPLGTSGHAESPSPPASADVEAARFLAEGQARARAVEGALAALPSVIQEEKRRIMDHLDEWSQSRLPSLVERHQAQVAQALEGTSLPEDLSTWEVYWRHLKAGVGATEDLEALIRLFMNHAETRLAPAMADFQETLAQELQEEINRLLDEALGRIRKPFRDVTLKYFPFYQGMGLSPPRPRSSLGEIDLLSKDRRGPESALFLVTGLILVAGRKVIQRVLLHVLRSVVGKALAKLIPLLGWLLLAWEVWDATNAKLSLEDTMRQNFLEEYRGAVTAPTLWSQGEEGSLRTSVEREVEGLLRRFERGCQEEARRMLDVAPALAASDSLRDFVAKGTAQGRDFAVIAEQVKELRELFGEHLLARTPVEVLLELRALAPDLEELAILAREEDRRLIEEYQRSGKAYLEAVHAMGTRTFIELRPLIYALAPSGEGPPPWLTLRRAFTTLVERDKNRAAARGLLILLRVAVPPETFSEASLARVGAREDLFLALYRAVGGKAEILAALFSSEELLAKVARARDGDAEMADALLRQTTDAFWASWAEGDLRDLLAAARVRQELFRLSPDDAVRGIHQTGELALIYRESGRVGVELWYRFVGGEGGDVQKRWAREALSLAARGFDPDKLRTPEDLSWANFCALLPVGGPSLFDLLSRVGQTARFILVLGALALPLLFVIWVGKRIATLLRDSRRTPPAGARIYTPTPPPEAVDAVFSEKNAPSPALPKKEETPTKMDEP
ncbi:MAG TPA: hypothetical protein PK535_04690 [Synergistaceae bacterium]|nr:hypothetical protein [Synergistaceae bacterium]HQH78242.1 hypothetical protein [Synergistaceae bacterium]